MAGDVIPVAILGVVLLVVWIVLRFALKLTATLFRLGCFLILLLVLAVFAFQMLG